MRLILMASVAVSLALLVPNSSHCQELLRIDVLTFFLDTSENSDEFVFRARTSTSNGGVTDIMFDVTQPNGQDLGNEFCVKIDSQSQGGIFECRKLIPLGSAQGTWSIRFLRLTGGGNTVWIFTEQLRDRGFSVDFRNQPQPDPEPMTAPGTTAFVEDSNGRVVGPLIEFSFGRGANAYVSIPEIDGVFMARVTFDSIDFRESTIFFFDIACQGEGLLQSGEFSVGEGPLIRAAVVQNLDTVYWAAPGSVPEETFVQSRRSPEGTCQILSGGSDATVYQTQSMPLVDLNTALGIEPPYRISIR